MRILCIDTETYYSKEYSLSKMTTEAYVRDPRFELIGVGIVDASTGDRMWMEEPTFAEWAAEQNWATTAILCHHTHFDAAILSWRYGISPKLWLDTLSMARAVVGGFAKSMSLAKLSEHFGIGVKGTEVVAAMGKRREDFSRAEWEAYGGYCLNDCELTIGLFRLLMTGHYAPMERQITAFPKFELKLIDATVRMFAEPSLVLDTVSLRAELSDLRFRREAALELGGVPRDELMSNPKFAAALRALGVEPPMKTSPTTGKPTYAFAKTDKAMQELAEHEDDQVQALVAARLKNKSTIGETRTERLLGTASRGLLPVYLNYYGADQSGRMSGGEKVNLQNLPKKGLLRSSLLAPPGHMLVVIDSANIEARVVDALAGEHEAVEVFRRNDRGEGDDVYCYMASKRYGRRITRADTKERQFGKILVLACGYGMGGAKFRETARQWGLPPMSEEDATHAVMDYRRAHPKVVALWRKANDALEDIRVGRSKTIDAAGLLVTCRHGVIMPNGLTVKYPNIRRSGDEWVYTAGRIDNTRIYGGKCVENLVQGLARTIVMEQSLEVVKHHPCARLALSVHDEAVYVVPEAEAEIVAETAFEVFSTPPTWWPDVPLSAEAHIGFRYSEAK